MRQNVLRPLPFCPRQMFLENRVGSLEVGKDADVAVWDRNMYAIAPAALKDLRCELTMIAGRVVFRSGL